MENMKLILGLKLPVVFGLAYSLDLFLTFSKSAGYLTRGFRDSNNKKKEERLLCLVSLTSLIS